MKVLKYISINHKISLIRSNILEYNELSYSCWEAEAGPLEGLHMNGISHKSRAVVRDRLLPSLPFNFVYYEQWTMHKAHTHCRTMKTASHVKTQTRISISDL